MQAYHDQEWGVPLHDDRALFELLCLEGAQAGLSWSTILKRREGYRRAFDGFVVERVAAYDGQTIERLLRDVSIVRNRSKIESAIGNARGVIEIQHAHGSFDRLVWSFVGGRPLVHAIEDASRVPSSTDESRAMSRALREWGFRFVGPTICYAYMQAAGLVNDHFVSCPARSRIIGSGSSKTH